MPSGTIDLSAYAKSTTAEYGDLVSSIWGQAFAAPIDIGASMVGYPPEDLTAELNIIELRNFSAYIKSTVENTNDLDAGITGLQTLFISNFSLGIEEWAVTSGLIFSVDVVDATHGVSTSGTYFVHHNQAVTTTYSGISNGYRFYYAPTNMTDDGTIDLIIHAENLAGGIVEETYHLLYGFNVSFDELMDWGPGNEIITTIIAKNEAFCPNIEGESFSFETRDLWSYDLGATIHAVGYVDLGASIYPQSTTFFYGQTYRITISGVKDYHGNTMDPYIFTFTIENPND